MIFYIRNILSRDEPTLILRKVRVKTLISRKQIALSNLCHCFRTADISRPAPCVANSSLQNAITIPTWGEKFNLHIHSITQ